MSTICEAIPLPDYLKVQFNVGPSTLDINRESLSLCCTYSGISLSWLGELLGEDDQFGFVLLQSLHIVLESFNRLVAATVVNSNANGRSLLLVDASILM